MSIGKPGLAASSATPAPAVLRKASTNHAEHPLSLRPAPCIRLHAFGYDIDSIYPMNAVYRAMTLIQKCGIPIDPKVQAEIILDTSDAMQMFGIQERGA